MDLSCVFCIVDVSGRSSLAAVQAVSAALLLRVLFSQEFLPCVLTVSALRACLSLHLLPQF